MPSRPTLTNMDPPPNNQRPGHRRALDLWWLDQLQQKVIEPAQETQTAPPPELMVGIAQFNEGQFFESHETWENLWRSTDYPLRLFYFGLTKLGAGFTHARRGNPTSMRRLLNDGVLYLEPFTPGIMGLDIDGFTREIRRWLSQKNASPSVKFPSIELMPAKF